MSHLKQILLRDSKLTVEQYIGVFYWIIGIY